MAEQSSMSIDYEPEAVRLERQTNVMTITELEGKQRVITLSSSSMPLQGVSWGMQQRVSSRWPAGAPEATQQLLGPTQAETQMRGRWKRTWLGRNPVHVDEGGRDIRIVQPATVRDLFYDVLVQGSLLQVTWKSITRMGRLAQFQATHDRDTDIDWTASFDWINSGSLFPYRMVSTREKGVKAEVEGLLLLSDSLVELEATEIPVDMRPPKPSVPQFDLGQVHALLDAPAALVRGLGQRTAELLKDATDVLASIGGLGKKFKNLPKEIKASLQSSSDEIIKVCDDFHDEITRTPVELTTQDYRVGSMLQTHAYYRESQRIAGDMARTAEQLKTKTNSDRETTGDLLALHMVKQGDTLAGISAKYYGSPDRARDIAISNGLSYPIAIVTTENGKPSMGGKTILSIPRL